MVFLILLLFKIKNNYICYKKVRFVNLKLIFLMEEYAEYAHQVKIT